MWSDQCLEVDSRSSVDVLEGQHLCLESDVGRNRKSEEVTKEAGHMGEFGNWSSQEGVAVVQVGDDQRLDKELRCVFCEERLDPVDVVEGKSSGSGPQQ